MKKRDDVIRNGGVAQTTTLPAIAPAPKKKALTQAPSPVRKLVNFDSQEGDLDQVASQEDEEIDLEKPPTPMTLRALQFYNSLKGSQARRSLDPRGNQSIT